MKNFWKVLGFAALAAGLTPYKVEKNEETGENSYQALLWRITSAPSQEEGKGRKFGINLGEGTLTAKMMEKMEKGDEPHLFSDEISSEYNGAKTDENGEETVPVVDGEAAGREVEKIIEAAEATECAAEKVAGMAEAAEQEMEKIVETAEAAESEAEKIAGTAEPEA